MQIIFDEEKALSSNFRFFSFNVTFVFVNSTASNAFLGTVEDFLKYFGMGNDHSYWLDLFVLVALISVAGILGNVVGYWFGKRFGHGMYSWRDRWLFKKRYLHEAHDFYEKHGGGAIVLARFVPIIRTFAPLIAGIVNMDRAKFSYYNILGSVSWVTSMILGGFFLQRWLLKAYDFDLKEHLEIIVIGIVLVSTLPILIKLFFGKKKKVDDTIAK